MAPPSDIVSNIMKELDRNSVRTSLTEQITTELRRRILNGQLAAGTTLRQERLATELGVSRIPLREAIRHLESEGLVVSELHKGAVVSSLSPDELEELFGIRMQLVVVQDVDRELSDHHAMLAYARLCDVERGVDMLRRHIARVSRNLMASLSRNAENGLKNIA
jgi:DNA-binding GntR family transcriptional regulator